jgi:flagellar capping protein FliD
MITLVALTALSAALIGSTSAQAAGRDNSSCVFQGLTGSLNPPIPPPPAGNGQTGTYTFNGTSATCVIVDTEESAGNSAVVPVTINSAGRYSNIACGTGTAIGDTTVGPTTVTGANSELPISASGTSIYTINFAGGTGPLTFGSGVTDADGEAISGGGHVTITPSNTGGCVTVPAQGFSVAGSFTAAT